MNKLQYIEILKMRGITELRGITLAQALRKTGGEPTEIEVAQADKNIINNERKKKLNKINESR